MTLRTTIGSGRALFDLPGDKFINATQPLAVIRPLTEPEYEWFFRTGGRPIQTPTIKTDEAQNG